MSIANELSSEIAAAMLSHESKENSVSRGNLKDILVEVHSTLQHLTAATRRKKLRPALSATPPPSSSSAAHGAG